MARSAPVDTEQKLTTEEKLYFIFLDAIQHKLVDVAKHILSQTNNSMIRKYLIETYSFNEEDVRVIDTGIVVNKDAVNLVLGQLIQHRKISMIETLALLFKPDVCGFELANGQGRYVPICAAAKRGFTDIVQLLMKLGADINAEDRYGRTAHSYLAFHKEAKALCSQLTHVSLFSSSCPTTRDEEARYKAIFS